MHVEAFDFVRRFATAQPLAVLDLGGRDVNGTARPLFPAADYTVVDLTPGSNVDIVGDAATWRSPDRYDLVVSTEVFEHTPDWRAICVTAHEQLLPGGRVVVTCAGPGRAPHSGVDGNALRGGEWYANLDAAGLRDALEAAGFVNVVVEIQGLDLRATAVRRET
jgi:trans-aconitate methyltransferase